MGACSPLVRGTYAHLSISRPSFRESSAHVQVVFVAIGEGELTACTRAPDPEPPLVTATALPLMSVLDFCLFTTIWDDPKEFEAGRFAADILAVTFVGTRQLEGHRAN